MTNGCGAPAQGGTIESDTTETVLEGKVLSEGTPVGGAFVRLLDSTGEFTAEVVSSPEGDFRFFAAPGTWTLRTLAPKADPVDRQVVAQYGEVAEVAVAV